MKKQLEQYFGCEVKVTKYENKLQLPIFMTMRNIKFALVNIVRESKLTIAAMKKQRLI